MRALRQTAGVWWVASLLAAVSAFPPACRGIPPRIAANGRDAGAETATTVPADDGQSETIPPKATADELRTGGIEAALAGHFRQGLDMLHSAQELDGDDPRTARAAKLLEAYLARCSSDRREQAEEYDRAVRRVRRAMLAQSYRDDLDQADVTAPLREKVEAVATAYFEADKSDALATADAEEAEEMKSAAVTSLIDARGKLTQAVEMLDGDDGQYADTFRELASPLDEQLAAWLDAWEKLDPSDKDSRTATVVRLEEVALDLPDAVDDLEAMIAEDPWAVGVYQAALARRIAPEKVSVAETDWYRAIVALIRRVGADAVADARWHDALGAYAGLEELDPDNPEYEQQVQVTRRHVRVLRLYGEQDDDEAETLPADDETEDDEPRWKELTVGVDADMVKNAISQIDQLYVTAADYREIVAGALRSVKVLAETPQAARSFPQLSDDIKRRDFVGSVDSVLSSIERRDRVDHLDVQLALNTVIRASERTVQIPVEVIAFEFADGLLDELDKFSSMIWPSEVDDFQKQTMGHFYGVGIQITKEEGEPLQVVTPLADSPALKAGIQAEDIIVAVDGRATQDLELDKLVRMITGEKGTEVVLRIKRPGLIEPRDITVVRDEIHIHTVKGWERLPGGTWDYRVDSDENVGYVRVTQFTGKTPADVDHALSELKDAGIRSVVIDLRFNPGGLLSSAVEVADEFLRSGRIVSTKGRRTSQAESATSHGEFLEGDVVVLVNQHSASAAEIVSGALSDWRRATIVGGRTFGKGSVQNVIPIHRHRALLRLTTAYYYLPKGKLIHRRNGDEQWGVEPDIKVTLSPKQTRRWLEIRRKTDLLRDVDADQLADQLAEQYHADTQLATGVLLLELMQLQREATAAALAETK